MRVALDAQSDFVSPRMARSLTGVSGQPVRFSGGGTVGLTVQSHPAITNAKNPGQNIRYSGYSVQRIFSPADI